MKLSDFKYNLPKTAIAKFPLEQRDQSRLMVLNRATKEIEEKKFADVIDYMSRGDVLVVNESRVIQARLFGTKERTNAKIEVFVLRELNKKEGLTILFITHDIGVIADDITKLVTINQKASVCSDPKEMMNCQEMSDLYGIEAHLLQNHKERREC